MRGPQVCQDCLDPQAAWVHRDLLADQDLLGPQDQRENGVAKDRKADLDLLDPLVSHMQRAMG